jgi:hypothetical protein
MSHQQDWRDWYIMIHISIFGLGLLAYVFKNPSVAAFGTMCGTLTTVIGMYHWFTIRDDKTPDAAVSS